MTAVRRRSGFPTRKGCDVLGLGCTAVDDILYLPAYPAADAKVEVQRRERHCGGLCATALVAAARLGARCAYAGAWGEDEASRFVETSLRREGIHLQHARRRPGAGPVRSVILVDERRRTRNIFYHIPATLGAEPAHPPAEVIRGTRVLLVDRFGLPGMIRAARLARRAGIPVVGDFESCAGRRLDELLALTDHLIVSEDFARRFCGARTPARAARRLWRPDRAVVVVTCGAAGCWFLGQDTPAAVHRPAFRVRAVDTTGCGDVFHGAYAAALARGLNLAERLRVASATAALKATQRGGQAGIPSLRQVESFLRRNPA
jgi:sugar/nucleoside kinase (ribokinase family)